MSSSPACLPLGPVMLDVAGSELTVDEAERLRHPLVGGVILFARNFESPEQLAALTRAIRAQRDPAPVIAVDQEGGRVQRFRAGFTRLPPMRCIGQLWSHSPAGALEMAARTGRVLASELLARGVDLSFAPVLDLDYGRSAVVGDRSFHADPQVVDRLAEALAGAMAECGMGCVGKHFPGHGYAEADSHVAIPVDPRGFDEIWAHDLQPYRGAIGRRLAGVMPAHVIFSQVDPSPAGFSPFWLQQVLRGRIGFRGAIFSDDLSMEGATVAGGIVDRAFAAYRAGCDMVLVCNRPDLAGELLDRWRPQARTESAARILALRAAAGAEPGADPLAAADYLASRSAVEALAGALG